MFDPTPRSSVVAAALLSLSLFVSCGPSEEWVEEEDSLELSDDGLTTSATVKFATAGVTTTGPLTATKGVKITYDSARLPDCRGTNSNGTQAWSITGYASLNGAAPTTFVIGGYNPNGGGTASSSVTLPLSAAGELAVWFQITNRWGCQSWDSNFGANHRFKVYAADHTQPDWLGNVGANITRTGGGCASATALQDGGFRFDTWSRSRAADTLLCFEAYEPGVTDRANPDLWKQLDARIYYRYGSSGTFKWTHVNFDRRAGNNAGYRFELRDVDPFRPYQTGCPTAKLTRTADGQYVQATLEFYFQVNGKQLRPSAKGTFKGHFEDYASSYTGCP